MSDMNNRLAAIRSRTRWVMRAAVSLGLFAVVLGVFNVLTGHVLNALSNILLIGAMVLVYRSNSSMRKAVQMSADTQRLLANVEANQRRILEESGQRSGSPNDVRP